MNQERVWCAQEQGCLLTRAPVAWGEGSEHGHPTRTLGNEDLAGDQALIWARKSSLNMEGWGDGVQQWETGSVTWASLSLLNLHLSISLAPRPVWVPRTRRGRPGPCPLGAPGQQVRQWGPTWQWGL